MTTLAYRDGVLAADSACTGGGTYYGRVRKLAKRDDGWIAGAAGATASCEEFLRWFLAGDERASLDLTAPSELGALVVDPRGKVFALGKQGVSYVIAAPFHADGSGSDIAIGAMAAGASAVEAVRIACRYDTCTRGPVRSVSL